MVHFSCNIRPTRIKYEPLQSNTSWHGSLEHYFHECVYRQEFTTGTIFGDDLGHRMQISQSGSELRFNDFLRSSARNMLIYL